MPRYYSNTAIQTTLVVPISAAATSITIGTASGLPIQFPYRLTLDFEASGAEVVEVTAAAGTTLTVIRGVDGTSAVAHSIGAVVAHTATAQDYRDTQDHIAAGGAVHGLGAGANVVGTTTPQTLTNKTIDGLANTITNVNAGAIGGQFKSTTIVATNATSVALKVQGFAGQTAPLQQWLAPDGSTVLASVDAAGVTNVASLSTTDGGLVTAPGGGSVFIGKRVDVTGLDPVVVPLKVKGVAAATADIFEVLNSAAAVLFKVAPNGDITGGGKLTVPGDVSTGKITATGDVAITGNASATGTLTAGGKLTAVQAVISQTGTTDPALLVKAQSGTANTKPYLQITNHLDAVIAKVDELGFWVGPGDTASLAVTTSVPSDPSNLTKVNYSAPNTEWDARDMITAAQPSRITAAVAGYYLVIHHANFLSNTTGYRGSDVRLNNGATYPLQLRVNPVGGGFNTMVGSSKVLKLAANDFLEHYVYQNSTIALTTILNFQCVFLGT